MAGKRSKTKSMNLRTTSFTVVVCKVRTKVAIAFDLFDNV